MKKITFLAVAFAALSFASCKKNYTCECTGEQKFLGQVTTSKVTYTVKAKRSEAGTWCDNYDSYMDMGNGDYQKFTCDLK